MIRIDPTSSVSWPQTLQMARPPRQKEEAKPEQSASAVAKEYETYGPASRDDEAIVRLREESEKAYSGLRQLVEQLLARQGLSMRDAVRGSTVEVDETARAEAAALVADDGELGAEAVSTRIVDFAKALSGGDPTKIGMLRGAIEMGFREAARVLGGTLPEVSLRTYDLVMQKLDAWAAE